VKDRTARQRRDKSKQSNESGLLVGGCEGMEQRCRHRVLGHGPAQKSARRCPPPCARHYRLPPLPPAGDGAGTDARKLPNPGEPLRSWPMAQYRHQDHGRRGKDLAPQKAHGRWGGSEAASFPAAAETGTEPVLILNLGRNASRLTWISPAVKDAVAERAALRLDLRGNFLIQLGESGVKGGIGEQSLVQSSCLTCFGKQRRQKKPLGKLKSSFSRGGLPFPHSA